MTIIELLAQYNTEEICRNDFKERRESQGVKCKKCGCKKHYWLSSKSQWECSKCSFRTGLKSGSFMEHSKLSVLKWYQAIILISFSKKGLSAKEIQRQLQLTRYESTWYLMHRIRRALAKQNAKISLSGTIEFDEGYFTVLTSKKRVQKRGRGSNNKAKVAIMVESTPLENPKTGEKYNALGHVKMNVLQGHQQSKIDELLENKIAKNSLLITDKSTSYNGLSQNFEHYSLLSEEHTKLDSMKWVHIAISNIKRKLLGINHGVKREYLQNYLDEFCFKLNLRKEHGNITESIITAVANNYWY